MRVLLQNRLTSLRAVAGDGIQVIKTLEYLRKIGVEAELDCSLEADPAGFDVVHLFNLIPVEDTYRHFAEAKKSGGKIVLSTIFWTPEEYLGTTAAGPEFSEWWRRTMPLREAILAGVDLILPNSRRELEVLKQYFRKLPPAVVVPNAADSLFASARPERFIGKYKRGDFLLAVGRISPRKNQLALIKAAKELKLPLVLIGPLNDGEYYLKCRREAAGSRVLFIDTLSQSELASAYAAARVHALVSWYDTPGLVSLEAALAGCAIVSTDRGCAAEYLGELAFYCDPADLGSIRTAIEKAWRSPKNPALKEEVLRDFIWEKTALRTYEAYQFLFK